MNPEGDFNFYGFQEGNPFNQQNIELEFYDEVNPPNRRFQFHSPSEIMKKLDGFVTLGPYEYKSDFDQSMMQDFQLDQAEEKDFNLQKIFEEQQQPGQQQQQQSHQQQQQQQPQQQQQINQKQNSSQQPINQQSHYQEQSSPRVEQQERPHKYPRKGSSSLPSFPELLDRMIENFIENFSPNSFQEYNRYQEAMNNIPNFLFLEQKLKYPFVLNNFHGHYLRFIEKMKQYHMQQRLDFKQMISFVCSMGLEFIQDVLNVIKKADSAWCFETFKNSQEQSIQSTQTILDQIPFTQHVLQSVNYQQQQQQQENTQQISQTQQQSLQSQLNQSQQLQQLAPQQSQAKQQQPQQSLQSLKLQQQSSQSMIEQSEQEMYNKRQSWTSDEMQILNRCLLEFPSQIPKNIMLNLSESLNRTISSIQSKINKLRRSTQPEQSISEIISSQSMILVSVQASKLSNSDISSDDPQIVEHQKASGQKSRQGSKYNCSIEEMIKIALNQLPGVKGTKTQITDKIKQIYFPLEISDTQWIRSVSMVLSSKQSSFIKKVKGAFSNISISDEQLNQENGSPKHKLHQIIRMMPSQRGVEFRKIFDTYLLQESIQTNDVTHLKALKKKLNQTLLNSNWFSKTKTYYCLATTFDSYQRQNIPDNPCF